MTSILIFCTVSTFVLSACSSTKLIDLGSQDGNSKSLSINKFNREIKNQSVKLTLKDGRKRNAESVYLAADSTSIKDSDGNTLLIIPSDSISDFQTTNNVSGIPGGIFFGVLIGGVSSAIFQPTSQDVGGAEHRISIPEGAIIGGAVGLVVGLAVGGQTVYKFKNDFPASSNVGINFKRAPTAHHTQNNDARVSNK